MTTLVKTYIRLLNERPFVANVMTSSTFMVAGDLISQKFFQQKTAYDLEQTIRFALSGLLFVGPVVRGSLVAIDRVYGPTNSIKTLAKKIFTDQCLCAPTFIGGNLLFMSLMKCRELEGACDEVRNSYFSILKMNYSFWPFIQVINFYFIPLTYRVLFGSSAALIWNTLFSYVLNQKSVPKDQQSAK